MQGVRSEVSQTAAANACDAPDLCTWACAAFASPTAARARRNCRSPAGVQSSGCFACSTRPHHAPACSQKPACSGTAAGPSPSSCCRPTLKTPDLPVQEICRQHLINTQSLHWNIVPIEHVQACDQACARLPAVHSNAPCLQTVALPRVADLQPRLGCLCRRSGRLQCQLRPCCSGHARRGMLTNAQSHRILPNLEDGQVPRRCARHGTAGVCSMPGPVHCQHHAVSNVCCHRFLPTTVRIIELQHLNAATRQSQSKHW